MAHHRIIGRNAVQHGRGDLQCLSFELAADNSFFAVQQAKQTIKVLLVHNSAVVWVFQRLGAVLGGDLPLQLRYQGVLYFPLAQHIVRGYAGLTTVEILPKDNPAGRQGQIGSGVYNAGALAPQFQHGGRQGLGGMPQYLPPHGLAAGEKHQIKLLLQQRAVLLTSAGDHRYMGRVKGLPDQLFDYGAGGGGVGTGLDHGGVAGGNGVSQGIYGQEEGIVPWAHNQHIPVGGGHCEAPGGELGQGRADCALSGKTAQVLAHVADLRLYQPRLTHKALKSALA